MNSRTLLTVVLLSVSACTQAATPCQEKQQDILREISYAEKHHNQRRIEGLNRALTEVKARCRDTSQRHAAVPDTRELPKHSHTGQTRDERHQHDKKVSN